MRKIRIGGARGLGVSRGDAERLLSGRSPEAEDAAGLVSALRALESLRDVSPTEVEAQAFAAQAAKLVPETKAPQAALPVGAPRPRRTRLRPAFAGTLAALVLMVSASAGVAYAADGAVPGDVLYGLDLALEKIGLGDGALDERLAEAGKLVERGQVQAGLAHAGDAVASVAAGDEGLRAAAEALWAVADSVAEGEGPQTPEGRALLAQRLREMGSIDPGSKEFGQAVEGLDSKLDTDGQNDGGSGSGPPTDNGSGGDGQGQGTTGTTGTSGGNGTGTGGRPGL